VLISNQAPLKANFKLRTLPLIKLSFGFFMQLDSV
jgi:hypothetical protein